jgi:HSF-type DNA-binding
MNISSPFLSQYPHQFPLRNMSGARYGDQRTEINTLSALASLGQPRATLPFPLHAYQHSFPRPDADHRLKTDGEKKFEIPPRYTRNGRKRAIPFPLKLMQVLSDEEYSHIISWMPNGKSFVILRPKAFVTEVLPSNFKSAQYASFTRKLTRWGFVRCEEGTGEFHHPKFRKGRFDLVEKMAPAHGATSATAAIDDSKSAIEGVKEVEFTAALSEVSKNRHEKDEMLLQKLTTEKSMPALSLCARQPAAPRTSPFVDFISGTDASERMLAAHHSHFKNVQREMEAFRLRQSIDAIAKSRKTPFSWGEYPMNSTSIEMSQLMMFPPSLLGRFGSSAHRIVSGLGTLQTAQGTSLAAAAASYTRRLDAAQSSAAASFRLNIDPALSTNPHGAMTF